MLMVGPPGAGKSVLCPPAVDPAAVLAGRAPRSFHDRLDGKDMVPRIHFAEALAYRALTDDLRRAV